jgi:thiaminase (transcriptional activator TenA)
MPRFSEEAWQASAALRAAVHALPFNTELAAGTLAHDRFRHYITQDALYLGQFSRCLAIAAAKAPDAAVLQSFAQSALGAVAVERALHEQYLRQFGVDPAALATAEPAPDCLAYTSFLIATAYHEPWAVLVAALLPCFWLYWDVGCAIANRAASDNPYRAWIDTYADPRFGEAVAAVIATADGAADATTPAGRAKMHAAFTRACQYEWLFWDGAYQRRGWPAPG